MRTTAHINLVVLRDVEFAEAAIHEAIAQGDASVEPGLRRALEILRDFTQTDDDLKVRWARQYLDRAGVPAGENSVRAVKKLRDAVPTLGLADAVELVKLAAER